MQRIAIILQQYAGYLLVVGLASVFYNPQARVVGWYGEGKTGLIALGASAVLAFICGALAGKGKQAAGWAGIGLAFMLLSFCGYKAFSIARGVAGDTLADHKWYQATLFGIAFFFSVLTFIKLGTALRRDNLA